MTKQQAKEKIEYLAKTSFNEDQKKLAMQIIDNCPDETKVQEWYNFIIQRIKIGFTFDSAPESDHNFITILEEDKSLNINIDSSENENNDENYLIIGENYDALKNLLITHKDKIDIIYIDPPYNTEAALKEGNGIADDKENISSTKFIYRDKYARNGWLNMMQERLILSKDLLKDDGIIFVSIDDNEQGYLKILMDEIFGEENFVSTIIWDKTSQGQTLGDGFKKTHEYIHMFSKNKDIFKIKKQEIDVMESKYKDKDDTGFYATTNTLNSINSYLEQNKNRGYTIYYNDATKDVQIKFEYDKETLLFNEFDQDLILKNYYPIRPTLRKGKQTCWNWQYERFLDDWKKEIVFKKHKEYDFFPWHKNRFSGEKNPFTIQKFDSRKDGNGLIFSILDNNNFDFPKPYTLIKWLINRSKNKNAIVLDFFAGSGTTAQSIMELNNEDNGERKFILITNDENNISKDIMYERIFRIIKGYGTNNEIVNWAKLHKPFLSPKVRVFKVSEPINIKLEQDINVLLKKAEKIFKTIDINYKKSKINFLRDLTTLYPLKK